MIDKIMKLIGRENINNIKIAKEFKNNKPKSEKMTYKWNFYQLYGKFEQPIVLDKNNYLIDGYTTYLIAKQLGKKYIKVKRVNIWSIQNWQEYVKVQYLVECVKAVGLLENPDFTGKEKCELIPNGLDMCKKILEGVQQKIWVNIKIKKHK